MNDKQIQKAEAKKKWERSQKTYWRPKYDRNTGKKIGMFRNFAGGIGDGNTKQICSVCSKPYDYRIKYSYLEGKATCTHDG